MIKKHEQSKKLPKKKAGKILLIHITKNFSPQKHRAPKRKKSDTLQKIKYESAGKTSSL